MQTIGQYVRDSRRQKNISISQLEEATKIKKDFLRAIEADAWALLPEYPVVLGFIKSIARALEANEQKAVALLRRDYPPHQMNINPKPDLPKEFRWSPKLTFVAAILVVLTVVFGYLGVQYRQFISPPALEIIEPTEGQVVKKRELKVVGKTDPESTVKVNNQPVLVGKDGTFETELEVFEGTKLIEAVAVSRSGKESRVSRTIDPQLQ